MDYFKIAIIGSNGNIDVLGSDIEELHSICLLDYANNNYDNKIFKQLNLRHRPEVISYFLVSLYSDIVFLNTTKDVKKYGYMGILMLPDALSDTQRNALNNFLDKIENFSICLATNLYLEDGLLQASESYSVSDESPRSLVDRYFESRNM